MAENDEPTQEYSSPKPVGDRLRAAREEEGLSLEEIAEQTRIPRRHLESLEAEEWDKLPAATYTIGFAKSYASLVGLDRNEIAEQLKAEMGGDRPEYTASEVYQPADPARTMPIWLVLGAIVAVILLVIALSWWSQRRLEPEEPAVALETQPQAPAAVGGPVQPQPQQVAPQGPVVLTAVAPAWIQVTDQGRTLFQGELATGQSYTVPATAVAPRLRAGKPEALRVTVGGAPAPQVGPPGRVASNVDLAPAELMRQSAPETATNAIAQ